MAWWWRRHRIINETELAARVEKPKEKEENNIVRAFTEPLLHPKEFERQVEEQIRPLRQHSSRPSRPLVCRPDRTLLENMIRQITVQQHHEEKPKVERRPSTPSYQPPRPRPPSRPREEEERSSSSGTGMRTPAPPILRGRGPVPDVYLPQPSSISREQAQRQLEYKLNQMFAFGGEGGGGHEKTEGKVTVKEVLEAAIAPSIETFTSGPHASPDAKVLAYQELKQWALQEVNKAKQALQPLAAQPLVCRLGAPVTSWRPVVTAKQLYYSLTTIEQAIKSGNLPQALTMLTILSYLSNPANYPAHTDEFIRKVKQEVIPRLVTEALSIFQREGVTPSAIEKIEKLYEREVKKLAQEQSKYVTVWVGTQPEYSNYVEAFRQYLHRLENLRPEQVYYTIGRLARTARLWAYLEQLSEEGKARQVKPNVYVIETGKEKIQITIPQQNFEALGQTAQFIRNAREGIANLARSLVEGAKTLQQITAAKGALQLYLALGGSEKKVSEIKKKIEKFETEYELGIESAEEFHRKFSWMGPIGQALETVVAGIIGLGEPLAQWISPTSEVELRGIVETLRKYNPYAAQALSIGTAIGVGLYGWIPETVESFSKLVAHPILRGYTERMRLLESSIPSWAATATEVGAGIASLGVEAIGEGLARVAAFAAERGLFRLATALGRAARVAIRAADYLSYIYPDTLLMELAARGARPIVRALLTKTAEVEVKPSEIPYVEVTTSARGNKVIKILGVEPSELELPQGARYLLQIKKTSFGTKIVTEQGAEVRTTLEGERPVVKITIPREERPLELTIGLPRKLPEIKVGERSIEVVGQHVTAEHVRLSRGASKLVTVEETPRGVEIRLGEGVEIAKIEPTSKGTYRIILRTRRKIGLPNIIKRLVEYLHERFGIEFRRVPAEVIVREVEPGKYEVTIRHVEIPVFRQTKLPITHSTGLYTFLLVERDGKIYVLPVHPFTTRFTIEGGFLPTGKFNILFGIAPGRVYSGFRLLEQVEEFVHRFAPYLRLSVEEEKSIPRLEETFLQYLIRKYRPTSLSPEWTRALRELIEAATELAPAGTEFVPSRLVHELLGYATSTPLRTAFYKGGTFVEIGGEAIPTPWLEAAWPVKYVHGIAERLARASVELRGLGTLTYKAGTVEVTVRPAESPSRKLIEETTVHTPWPVDKYLKATTTVLGKYSKTIRELVAEWLREELPEATERTLLKAAARYSKWLKKTIRELTPQDIEKIVTGLEKILRVKPSVAEDAEKILNRILEAAHQGKLDMTIGDLIDYAANLMWRLERRTVRVAERLGTTTPARLETVRGVEPAPTTTSRGLILEVKPRVEEKMEKSLTELVNMLRKAGYSLDEAARKIAKDIVDYIMLTAESPEVRLLLLNKNFGEEIRNIAEEVLARVVKTLYRADIRATLHDLADIAKDIMRRLVTELPHIIATGRGVGRLTEEIVRDVAKIVRKYLAETETEIGKVIEDLYRLLRPYIASRDWEDIVRILVRIGLWPFLIKHVHAGTAQEFRAAIRDWATSLGSGTISETNMGGGEGGTTGINVTTTTTGQTTTTSTVTTLGEGGETGTEEGGKVMPHWRHVPLYIPWWLPNFLNWLVGEAVKKLGITQREVLVL